MSAFPQLYLKDGDIKECCIPEPTLKGIADISKLEDLAVTGQIRKCSKGAEPVELHVVRDGQKCEWCFVIDTTALDGTGNYEIEFEVTWTDDGDHRVCHWPDSGFIVAEVQASL